MFVAMTASNTGLFCLVNNKPVVILDSSSEVETSTGVSPIFGLQTGGLSSAFRPALANRKVGAMSDTLP